MKIDLTQFLPKKQSFTEKRLIVERRIEKRKEEVVSLSVLVAKVKASIGA